MIEWHANQPKPDVYVRKAALTRFHRRFPERMEIRLSLADQHLHLGEIESAWKLLDAVPQRSREDPRWLAVYGKVALELGQEELAEQSLSAAWENGSIDAGIELSGLHTARKQHEDAIFLCYSILARDTANFSAAQLLSRNLIASGELGKLGSWAFRALENEHWNAALPSVIAYVSQSEARNGVASMFQQLGEWPVCIEDLTGASKQADLTRLLQNHQAHSNFSPRYAAKGTGRRIEGVNDLGINEVTKIFDRIKAAVESHSQKLSSPIALPFSRKIPQNVTIQSWVTICVGDGYEDWHCHPAGWLSGVYYLDIPDVAEATKPAGQIEFGPLRLGGHNDLDIWPKKLIEPRNDMLLLFPSCIGHRTYPTGLNEPRVSLAFDIVPAV